MKEKTTLRNEIERMVQVARLYYEQGLTQDDIAERLRYSRPTISRLLKKALDEKIVIINILDPFSYDSEISDSLKNSLGLKQCVVVSGQTSDVALIRKNIALTAANYLSSILRPGDIVGMGWGRTLFEIVELLDPHPIRDLLFVPMLGGIGQVKPSLQVHNITQKISDAYEGKWIQYHVPGILDEKDLHEQLMKTNKVQEMLQLWKKINKAIVGIGESPSSSEVIFSEDITEIEKNALVRCGAVGDICMRFFNENGIPVNYLVHEIMSIELKELSKIPDVIAVAGGLAKVNAIIGASRAKYIKTLITDELTAVKILETFQL